LLFNKFFKEYDNKDSFLYFANNLFFFPKRDEVPAAKSIAEITACKSLSSIEI